MTALPCVVCGKVLMAEPDALCCVYYGVDCESTGNYGSEVHDALFSGKRARFVICDECWKKADARGWLRWEGMSGDPERRRNDA